MSTQLLVVDANTAFATMIKQVLEDAGDYRATVVASAAEAIEVAARTAFDLAVVDMGLPDVPGGDAIRGLRATRPQLPIVAIPFETDSADPMFRTLDVQGFLTKPFFIPDLPEVIEEALTKPVGGVEPAPRQRTRLKNAPMIEDEPPAPPPSPFQRRPIRLKSNAPKSAEAEARPSIPERSSRLPVSPRPSPNVGPPPMSLTPQSTRQPEPTPPWLEDVSKAAQYLTTLTLQTAAEATLLARGPRLVAYAGQLPKQEAEELARVVDENWKKDGGQGTLMRFIKLSATGADYLLYATAATSDLVLAMAFQAETPISMIRKQARKIAESLLKPPSAAPTLPVTPVSVAPAPSAPVSSPPFVPVNPLLVAAPAAEPVAFNPPPVEASLPPSQSVPPAPVEERNDATRPIAFPRTQRQTVEPPPREVETAEPGGPEYEWLRPQPSAESGSSKPALPPEVVVDVGLPVPSDAAPPGLARTPHALYNLTYTYVWLPKFPKTRLIGDVSVRLDEWIRHTALAYDWRVQRLEVRPDCIVVIAMCPPATAPERVVRVLKRASSEKVLAEFSGLAAEHPAGDFWAPGYLLIGPGQRPTPQQIADYIAYTRREQGLDR